MEDGEKSRLTQLLSSELKLDPSQWELRPPASARAAVEDIECIEVDSLVSQCMEAAAPRSMY